MLWMIKHTMLQSNIRAIMGFIKYNETCDQRQSHSSINSSMPNTSMTEWMSSVRFVLTFITCKQVKCCLLLTSSKLHCVRRGAYLILCHHCWSVWDRWKRNSGGTDCLTLTSFICFCATHFCMLLSWDVVEGMELGLSRLDRFICVQTRPSLLWKEW